MKAVLIQRNLSKAEFFRLKNLNPAKTQVFFTEKTISTKIALLPNALKYSIPETIRKNISDDTFKKVIHFGGQKNGQRIVFEWLRTENSDVWNHAKFNVFFNLRNQNYELEEIESLKERYEQIDVFSSNNFIIKHLKSCQNITFHGPIQKEKPRLRLTTLVTYAWATMIRCLYSFSNSKKRKQTSHLILSRPSNLIQIQNGEYRNPFIGDIQNKSGQGFAVIDDNPPPPLRKKSNIPTGKRLYQRKSNVPVIFTDIYLAKALLSSSVRRKVNLALKDLRKTISHLENELHGFEDQALLHILRKELFPERLYLFKYFAFHKLFKSWKNLKSITATGENSGQTKAIFDAAKDCGITTIGLQHGTIHAQHPAYCFSKAEIKQGAAPDYTLVWGTEWANQLIKEGNYDPKSLVLVGQPRTDWMLESLDKTKSELKHLVDIQKHIIIFGSQNIPDEGLRKQIVTILFNTLKNIPEIELIIKLHPREPKTGFYEPIAEETGFKNYSVVQKTDLYYLIAVCSALITYTSTVGAETIYFFKKLFIIDPLNHDFLKYTEQGVAELATNQEQFETQFKAALKTNFKPDRNKCSEFIKKYSYKTDRKVAERCVSFIKSIE